MQWTTEVRRLVDWDPQVGDTFYFVKWADGDSPKGRELGEYWRVHEVRNGKYGIMAYEKDSSQHFSLSSESYFKKGIKMGEYTNLSDLDDLSVIPVGTQLYYNSNANSFTDGIKANKFKHSINKDGSKGVRYLSGGWDRVNILKVKTSDITPEIEYEDKWNLNDGTKEIPEDADKLMKDDQVVAYRLPLPRKIKVGDIVQSRSTQNLFKVLYIHNESSSAFCQGMARHATYPPASMPLKNLKLYQ